MTVFYLSTLKNYICLEHVCLCFYFLVTKIFLIFVLREAKKSGKSSLFLGCDSLVQSMGNRQFKVKTIPVLHIHIDLFCFILFFTVQLEDCTTLFFIVLVSVC